MCIVSFTQHERESRMNVQLIYQFPGTMSRKEAETARAWHWQDGADGLLAVAYVSDVVTYPPVETLSWCLVQIHTRHIVETHTSTYRFRHIEELHLNFDPITYVWVMGDIELQTEYSDYHMVIRVVRDEPDDQGLFFVPMFDDEANEMAPHGPLLTLQARDQRCTFIVLKSAAKHRDTPEVLRGCVDLVTAQSELVRLCSAESGLICREDQKALRVSLQPQMSVWARQMRRAYDRWGLVLAGYDADYQHQQWSDALPLHVPAGRSSILNQDPGNDFEWLGVNAMAIPGPLAPVHGSQTWIVGMTMMDMFRIESRIEDERWMKHTSTQASLLPRQVDALLYLDRTGEVLQTCANPLGLCVHLCCVGNMVVGVDLRAGHWRLWNWAPESETIWRVVVALDPQVKRAHVVAAAGQKPGEQATFWLIEELCDEVRISQRDAFTLKEVVTPVTLAHVRMLDPQKARGSLDWPTEVDALVYQEHLLLLGVNDADR